MSRSIKHLLLLFTAALLLLIYVLSFTPNIPVNDQWELVPLLKSANLGSLWKQHNEHRIFFPKLIYLALARLSHWNLKWETTFSLVLFFFLILYIWKSFSSQNQSNLTKMIFLCALLVQFSPIHHENLLWGWQLQITLCLLLIFISIINSEFIGVSLKSLLITIFSLFIATFSFFSGLLGWIVCAAAMIRIGSLKIVNSMLFIVSASAAFALYFIGFIFTKCPASLSIFDKAWQIPSYFLIYMGANFILTYKLGSFLPAVLISTGIWGGIFSLAGIYLIVKTYKYEKRKTIIPYSMMFFSVMAALSTSFGRVDYGLVTALLSRYHIFQMFYFIGFVWLMLLYLEHTGRIERYSRPLIILFLLINMMNWIGGVGLGIIKIKRIKPVEIEMLAKGEDLSSESASVIYSDENILREKIKLLKELKENIFHEKGRH